MQDKRQSQRHAVRWRSAIVILENGKEVTIQCKTQDVSQDGISVICHRNLPPRQVVTIYLLIDPGGPNRSQVVAEATGSVVNNVLSGSQGGFRLGIHFTQFAGESKQLLLNHLPRVMSSPARPAAAESADPFAH